MYFRPAFDVLGEPDHPGKCSQDDGAVQTSSTSYLASFELTPPMAGCVCIQVTGMIERTGNERSPTFAIDPLKKADSPSLNGLQHHVRINIVSLE